MISDYFINNICNYGWYNNREIGNLFGLGYFSINRRVSILESLVSLENKMNN